MAIDKRVIYRSDMIHCSLCHQAPCSEACVKGLDPAKLLRSIWFDNESVAALDLASYDACLGCEAPCEKACHKNVAVKTVLEKLGKVKQNTDPVDLTDESLLKTDMFGFTLENPYFLSSSVVGSTYDMCARAFDAGWAGVAFKTISLMDIHEASPRFSAIRGDSGSIIGFKNIEQLSDHSLVETMDIFRKLKENYPQKYLLASIMGRTEEEWEYLARTVTEAGADGIELNFSCPNMVEEGTGSDVGQSPRAVELFTRAARRGTTLPILAKLTPNVGSMSEAAEAAVRGGA
ncbi:MAG: NAD-dependent dihydropyrimidine dehydrogenase subunit PreA, partial [Spirochaetales bacterium]|nr:NAD-dependent dihydropyrimidine dehydrogenase subunit PreA [Candidatus Physcosoma equi]